MGLGTENILCGILHSPELRIPNLKAYYLVHFPAEQTLASSKESVRASFFSIFRDGGNKMKFSSLQARLWLPTAEQGIPTRGFQALPDTLPGPLETHLQIPSSAITALGVKVLEWNPRLGVSPRGWNDPAEPACLGWVRGR